MSDHDRFEEKDLPGDPSTPYKPTPPPRESPRPRDPSGPPPPPSPKPSDLPGNPETPSRPPPGGKRDAVSKQRRLQAASARLGTLLIPPTTTKAAVGGSQERDPGPVRGATITADPRASILQVARIVPA